MVLIQVAKFWIFRMHWTHWPSPICPQCIRDSLWHSCFCVRPLPPPPFTLILINVIKCLQPEKDMIPTWFLYFSQNYINLDRAILSPQSFVWSSYYHDSELYCLGIDQEHWHQFSAANGEYYLHKTFFPSAFNHVEIHCHLNAKRCWCEIEVVGRYWC